MAKAHLRLMVIVGLIAALLSPAQAQGGICTSASCRYLPNVSLNAGAVIINGFIVAGCNLRPPFGTCVRGDALNRGDRPVSNIVVNGWLYNTQLQSQELLTQTVSWPALFPGQSLPVGIGGVAFQDYPTTTLSVVKWTPILNTPYRPVTVVKTQVEFFPGNAAPVQVTTYVRNDQSQSLDDVQAVVWEKYGRGESAYLGQITAGQTVSFIVGLSGASLEPHFQVTAIGRIQSP